MKVSEAFPSQFLRAADLQGRTIKAIINIVQSEEVGTGEHKPVIYFQGKDKGLVLNKTNASTIAMAFGDDTDAWQNAEIELFPMAVPFQGQMVPAIRVRVPAEPIKTTPQAKADRIIPNAANRPNSYDRAEVQVRHDERNPPPRQGLDDDIPF